MSSSWQPTVRQVQDGESVTAGVTNRSSDDLASRTNYLKERLDAARLGELIAITDAALASDTFVGAAVYRDNDGYWKNAKAEVSLDTTLNYYTLKNSAHVQGIVVSKTSSTLGTVGLFGRVQGIDMTTAIGGAATHGQYYLSTSIAGRITRQRPPVGLPVCFVAPVSNEVFINPAPRDVLEDHVHYRIDLYAQPAGILQCNSSVGVSHVFHYSDAGSFGWLPANHASFSGLAPVGAAFGYNINVHTELKEIWPPLPVESCYLEMNGVGVPTSFTAAPWARVIIDRFGIWWMDPCYGSAPWSDPQAICWNGSTYVLSGGSGFGGPYAYGDTYFGTCGAGVDTPRRLTLHFTRMVFKTDSTVVTELESLTPSITVRGPQGQVAKTGALRLNLDLQATISNNQSGYQALKDITGSTFKRGPIVESVKAGDSSIVVTGDSTDAQGRVFGNLVIRAGSAAVAGGTELDVQLVDLNQATEEDYQSVLFLAFQPSIASSLRLKTFIPAGLSGNLKYRLWVMGTASTPAALPDLSASYRRIAAAPTAAPATALPVSDTSIAAIALSGFGTVSAYTYFQIDTASFAVLGNEIVFFTIGRAVDAYTGGMVGLLKIVPILT